MTTSVTIDCATANGKTLAALEGMIAARTQWLSETTAQAVTATAINVLSSIRAVTKVADPKKDTGMVNVAPYPGLRVSFRRVGRQKNVLCLRPPGRDSNGNHFPHAAVSFANAAGQPTKGFTSYAHVFLAQDRRSDSTKGTAKRYYIIARNLDDAKVYAENRRKRRVERYAGMAKWTIGQAQSQVSQRGVAAERVTGYAKTVGLRNLHTQVNSSGFSRGEVSIFVHDALKYALLALKGGPNDFQLAMQRAANRTAGIIHHTSARALISADPPPTPFPELSK